jgi:hypothetical protein
VEVNFLRKKSLLILGVIGLSLVLLVSAASYLSFTFNMSATVAEAGAVTITVDSTTYNTGESMSFNWGTVSVGANTHIVTITSTVNKNVTASISAPGIPSGWTLGLNDTSAIPAFGTVTRELVLTVPSNPTAGTFSWSSVLTVTS